MHDPKQLAEQLVGIGVSQPYSSQLSRGRRKPGLPLAIRIYRATSVKLGPISHLSDAEIDALEKMGVKRLTQ